jgi:hypothetical protein
LFRISANTLCEIADAGPETVLVLLKAYLDESRHSEGPKCVIAGWLGYDEQWKEFEKDWIKTLAPKRSLHMRELRWNSKPRRLKALLDRMGPIPDKHGLIRVAGGMKHQDYREVVAGTLSERALSPYMGCVQLCLRAMLDEIPRRHQLHVYLEQQEEYAHLVAIFNQVVIEQQKTDTRVTGLTLLQKDASVCFQAADYLAFHMSTKAIDPDDPKAVLTRPIYGPGIGFNYTRAMLEKHVAQVAREYPGHARLTSLNRFGASRKKR